MGATSISVQRALVEFDFDEPEDEEYEEQVVVYRSSRSTTPYRYGRNRAHRSGMVYAVAIINLVSGAIGLACMLLLVAGVGVVAALLPKKLVNNANDQKSLAILGCIGLYLFFSAFLDLLAGYLVWRRRQSGRILSIFLALFSGVYSVVAIAFDDKFGGITCLAYCFFVTLVLLQPKYAAEFR